MTFKRYLQGHVCRGTAPLTELDNTYIINHYTYVYVGVYECTFVEFITACNRQVRAN